VQTTAPGNANVFSILLSRKYHIQLLESQKHREFQLTVSHKHQHSTVTIRLFNHAGLSWKVLMNPHKWMCSLCMLNDMFAMFKASSSYHRSRKNGNIYTSEPARPPRLCCLDNHLSSDNSKKPITWKKLSAFHYFMLIIRIAFQIKLTRYLSAYIWLIEFWKKR